MKKLIFIFILILIPQFLFSLTYTEIQTNGWSQGFTGVKPAIYDIDNDGLLDLLIGDFTGTLSHYEQISSGANQFYLITKEFNNIDVVKSSAPTITDLDNDGLLDLLIGEDAEFYIYHYEQAESGSYLFNFITNNFSEINFSNRYDPMPTFTDLDSDSLLDLFVGYSNGTIYHFEQALAGSDSFYLVNEDFNNIDVDNK